MTKATHDFRYDILHDIAHRPWPMPSGRWLMTQTWRRLLFVHWPISPDALRPHVPPALPIDTFDGAAWLTIAAFEITNIAPRGVPALPWLSAFPEINVRTYVTLGGRPGVYFFSLDAGNALAVAAARIGFRLPYFHAQIRVADVNGATVYSSRRRSGPERFDATYKPVSAPFTAARGSLDEFLTERYCLYAITGRGVAASVDIHHPAWPLQRAEAEIRVNTLVRAFDDAIGGGPKLHYAERLDVVNWRLQNCATG